MSQDAQLTGALAGAAGVGDGAGEPGTGSAAAGSTTEPADVGRASDLPEWGVQPEFDSVERTLRLRSA